jgi:ankyrin repeat protein
MAALLLVLALACPAWAADPELVTAARGGDLAKVQALIKGGADVNVRDSGQMTPLLAAAGALFHAAEMTKLLLEKKAKVDAVDYLGRSALNMARDVEVARLLLDAGAGVEFTGKPGITPLMSAADPAVARLLIERGAKLEAKDAAGRTPLMFALGVKQRLPVAKVLLEKKADIAARDRIGRTPLLTAAMTSPEAVLLMLDAGAKIEEADKQGNTALMWASYSHPDTVKTLLEKGANVDARDKGGATALATAGSVAVAQILVDKGADVNAQDRWGTTPLLWAAHFVRLEVMRFLVSKGADPKSKNSIGETALIKIAQPRGGGGLVSGSTPTDAQRVTAAQFLIENGVDVAATDTSGGTALSYARKHKLAKLEAFLRANGAR